MPLSPNACAGATRRYCGSLLPLTARASTPPPPLGRIAAQQMIDELLDAYGKKALPPLLRAASARLDEAHGQRDQGSPHWWRLQEASILATYIAAPVSDVGGAAIPTARANCRPAQLPPAQLPPARPLLTASPASCATRVPLLCILQVLGRAGRVATKKGVAPLFAPEQVLRDLLLPAAAAGLPPLLRVRALCTAARLSPHLPPAAVSSILVACQGALEQDQPEQLRVSACRALGDVCESASLDGSGVSTVLAPAVGALLPLMVRLLEMESEDALLLALVTSQGLKPTGEL